MGKRSPAKRGKIAAAKPRRGGRRASKWGGSERRRRPQLKGRKVLPFKRAVLVMLLGSWLKQACWHSWQRSDSKQTPTTMSATNPLGGSTSSTAAPLARARWLQPIRGEFWPEEPRVRPGLGPTLGVLERLGGGERRAAVAGGSFPLSGRRSLHSNRRQRRCSPPHLTGTPSFSHLHITPPSQPAPFVSISFFLLISWKNNNKKKRRRRRREKRREAFTAPLAAHKGRWSGVYRSCPNLAKLKQRGVSRHVINPPKTSRRSFHRQSHHIKRKITNTNGRDQGECGGGASGSQEKGREKANWGEGKTAFRSGAEGPSTRPSCPATAALLFFGFVFFYHARNHHNHDKTPARQKTI